MKTINQYLDAEGRVKTWPSKHEQKMNIRCYLSTKFEYSRFYTEKEVNEILNKWHTFNDYFLLRRELINYRFLERTLNGARYWKGDISPEKAVETEVLRIETAVLEDLDELNEVYSSCEYMCEWTGQTHSPGDVERSIKEGDLPPEGFREFYKFKAIRDKETSEIIGIIDYYMGYPNKDTLWIGLLLIRNTVQNKGIGTQVVNVLAEEAKRTGFKHIGAAVHLKNWPAIRFWTKTGFDRITKVCGDKVIGPDRFSVIALSRDLENM